MAKRSGNVFFKFFSGLRKSWRSITLCISIYHIQNKLFNLSCRMEVYDKKFQKFQVFFLHHLTLQTFATNKIVLGYIYLRLY
jgi:hypothetical protein